MSVFIILKRCSNGPSQRHNQVKFFTYQNVTGLKTKMLIAFENKLWNRIRVDVVNVINCATDIGCITQWQLMYEKSIFNKEILPSVSPSVRQLSNQSIWSFDLIVCYRVEIQHFAHFIWASIEGKVINSAFLWNEKVQYSTVPMVWILFQQTSFMMNCYTLGIPFNPSLP